MGRNDRTGYYLTTTFKNSKTGEQFKTEVEIPFDIFTEAIRKYCNDIYDVSLDGTDTKIWNLFDQFDNGLDYFNENDNFKDICVELYDKSSTKEADEFEIMDDYDFLYGDDDI